LLLKDLQALGGKKGSAGGRDDPEIEEDDGVCFISDFSAWHDPETEMRCEGSESES
jgi:hypothetical protein